MPHPAGFAVRKLNAERFFEAGGLGVVGRLAHALAVVGVGRVEEAGVAAQEVTPPSAPDALDPGAGVDQCVVREVHEPERVVQVVGDLTQRILPAIGRPAFGGLGL